MVYKWMYIHDRRAVTDEDRRERGIGTAPTLVDQKTFRVFSKQNGRPLRHRPRGSAAPRAIPASTESNQQDRALQESQGRIVDRSKEHLAGPGDKAIGQTRGCCQAPVKTGRPAAIATDRHQTFTRSEAGEEVLRGAPTGHRSWRPTAPKRRSSRRCSDDFKPHPTLPLEGEGVRLKR